MDGTILMYIFQHDQVEKLIYDPHKFHHFLFAFPLTQSIFAGRANEIAIARRIFID
jgi:hypothetical protein